MWPLSWCRGIKSASVALSYPLLPKLSLLSSNTARSALVGDGSSGAETRLTVPMVAVVLVVLVGVLVAEVVVVEFVDVVEEEIVGGVVVVVVVGVVVVWQGVPWFWCQCASA